MAKKVSGADYGAAVSKLKIHGPERLYLIWGEEDYLRERFLDELRAAVLGAGADDFNYKRLEGRALDLRRLSEAVNAVPFLGDRCLVEVRDFDLNGCKDESFLETLEEIPETTTVCLVQDVENPPDGRLGLVKKLKLKAETLEFTAQGQDQLAKWIGQRFARLGKKISRADAEYLMFTSGTLMSQLIPEIEKLSNYVNSDTITRADIDAVAIRLPEARAFELTAALSARDFDKAAGILSDLLLTKEPPVKLVFIIGMQYRQLYAAKLLSPEGRGDVDELCKLIGNRPRFAAERLFQSARRMELRDIRTAVELCVDCEYRMKSASSSDEALLRELLAHLALGA